MAWLQIFIQIATMLFENCPQEATRENVQRVIKKPTRREKRMLSLAMHREADRQLDAFLSGDDDVALSDGDRDYICAEICEKLNIPHDH